MQDQFVMLGKVYLMGAGPGDPELLTVKAERLLRAADVVLHDDLVPTEILALASPRARVHNVGKRCGLKHTTQEEIHSRLIGYARQGLSVVRLKGGDPLIFGRAREELAALREAGIEVEVVPGVTAALSAAAAAQIPLTDRRLASKVIFVSNHQCAEKFSRGWREVISPDTTVVVYMPGRAFEGLIAELRAAGLDGRTPCAIVSSAARPGQQVRRMTLEELPEAARFPAPAVLIIGAVAAISFTAQDKPRVAKTLETLLTLDDRDSAEEAVEILRTSLAAAKGMRGDAEVLAESRHDGDES